MTPDSFFNLSCGIVTVGWIIIFFLSPFWKGWDKPTVGVIAFLVAAIYTYLNVSNFSMSTVKNFSSLEGVGIIFQNPYLLAAAWAHILAMDLMVAVWIKRNSVKLGISHWKIIPSLIFSLLFGPFGFILYLLTRWMCTKQYFADNAM